MNCVLKCRHQLGKKSKLFSGDNRPWTVRGMVWSGGGNAWVPPITSHPSSLHSITLHYLHLCLTWIPFLQKKFFWHFMLFPEIKSFLVSVTLLHFQTSLWYVFKIIYLLSCSEENEATELYKCWKKFQTARSSNVHNINFFCL